MFWFLLIAMVVVVAAVILVVVGGGDGGGLRDAEPDRLYDPLPEDRPVARADVETVRFPVTVRGYRMDEVDDVLDRLGAELAERDARIAELEAALAGAHASAMGGPGLIQDGPPVLGPVKETRPAPGPGAPEHPGTSEASGTDQEGGDRT
ncbi:DivIVA domain-containing protein [Streptomyces decoyicus]|uniref:DivIVA domain-containing protein n=1 Tax=Streptomyces decoyicus TaxID=249567 RepID=UPI002E1804C3|nr:DivIVA domain-containing protein [Streptomyces decoyicus]